MAELPVQSAGRRRHAGWLWATGIQGMSGPPLSAPSTPGVLPIPLLLTWPLPDPWAIIHPSWNPTTMNDDLTLLKLASPVRYTTPISPACLVSSNEALSAGLTCVTTGWVTSVVWVGTLTWELGGRLGVGGRQAPRADSSAPLLAHRQCDTGMGAAGGSVPGHCESVPMLLGLKDHGLHDLCRKLRCRLLLGAHRTLLSYGTVLCDTL